MTWRNLTSDYYYTATTSLTSTWLRWNDSTNYLLTPTQFYTIWKVWAAPTYSINTDWTDSYTFQPQKPVELTEEEKQRYENERIRMAELAREQAERQKEQDKKRQEAEEKALQLLLENLTQNQAEVYRLTGAIPVECQSGRKYHIRKGISHNVHELDANGGTARRLCFHPTDCPVYDVMLAQKLVLEVCEEDARKIANFS